MSESHTLSRLCGIFLNETNANHISFWFLEVFIKMLGIIFQRAKYWFLKIMPWFLEEMSMTKETKRGWICDIWNITFMGKFWVMNHFQDTFVVRDIWKLKLKFCLLSMFHVTSKPQLNDNPTRPKWHENDFAYPPLHPTTVTYNQPSGASVEYFLTTTECYQHEQQQVEAQQRH